MKTTALVLAALLATSGIALADGPNSTKKKVSTAPPPAQVQSGKVNCIFSGLFSGLANGKTAEQPVQPRLGYVGDPWIVPSFF
jgi:hypothetical protein